jgi:isochorismate synthase
MSGLLCFSLPDSKEIVKKFGNWTNEILNNEAFFVSNFNKSKRFFFREDESSNSFDTELTKWEGNATDTKEQYKSKVNEFIQFCQEDESRKVVLSRNAWTQIPINNVVSIFENLVNAYPSAFVYLIQSKEFGCWIGATPEKLLRGVGKNLTTMSLAGSRILNDPFEWTNKEIKEQSIVTEYISDILDYCKVSYSKSPSSTIRAGNIEHLSTEFKLEMNGLSPYELASKLHPTPAVCGLPQKEAIDYINSKEGYDRKLYTGIIGWSSSEETQLFVNLRCAQLFSNGVLSYVGGGITKDSDPEKEWLETEFKSQTLLSVIQKM